MLTQGHGWEHGKIKKALEAYAEFLTLKVDKEDYDATLLSPTDIIDEVSGKNQTGHPPITETSLSYH
jgi:ABC-type Fe3+-citrate transport system substrate-binding protein